MNVEHGTVNTYTKHKCRCPECRLAKSNYGKKLRAENPAKVDAASKRWKEKNSEKVKEARRRYYQENKDKVRRANKEWKAKNKDRVAEYAREYTRERPDVVRDVRHRRRSAIDGQTVTKVDLIALWTGRCGVCLDPMEWETRYPDPKSKSLDHIKPLSRGGTHSKENLQWAHLECNVNKGVRGLDG